MSACSVSTILDEKCGNPQCNNRLMPGTGLRFVSGGMEYSYCSVACGQQKIARMLADVEIAIRNFTRIDEVWRGK